jgi:hypothetical protein
MAGAVLPGTRLCVARMTTGVILAGKTGDGKLWRSIRGEWLD